MCNLLFFVQGFPKKCRNSMNGSRTKDRFSLVKVNNVFRQSAWGTQAVVLKAPLWAYCEGHVLVNKVKHFFIMDLPSPVGIELKNALNTVCPKKHLKIGSTAKIVLFRWKLFAFYRLVLHSKICFVKICVCCSHSPPPCVRLPLYFCF